jgi:uncharacterized protein (TIGR02246 family)
VLLKNMVANSRASAVEAVEEYGRAWATQDPARIAALFAPDAVYVERPYDEQGTFRGRAAIEAYWARQVQTAKQRGTGAPRQRR